MLLTKFIISFEALCEVNALESDFFAICEAIAFERERKEDGNG